MAILAAVRESKTRGIRKADWRAVNDFGHQRKGLQSAWPKALNK